MLPFLTLPVTAVKLKKEGYDVTGVTLRLYNQPNSSKSKSCCAGIDIDDAKKVAEQYNFPHKVFNKTNEQRVVIYMDIERPDLNSNQKTNSNQTPLIHRI